MNQTPQQKQLRALGYDPDDLPRRARCNSCNDIEPGDISYDLFSAYWTVWCGCGCSTDPQSDLIAAINKWNDLQSSLAVSYQKTNSQESANHEA